jgi:hypothetical protein
MDTEIGSIKNILFVEDDPRDVELTLAALEEYRVATGTAEQVSSSSSSPVRLSPALRDKGGWFS